MNTREINIMMTFLLEWIDVIIIVYQLPRIWSSTTTVSKNIMVCCNIECTKRAPEIIIYW